MEKIKTSITGKIDENLITSYDLDDYEAKTLVCNRLAGKVEMASFNGRLC